MPMNDINNGLTGLDKKVKSYSLLASMAEQGLAKARYEDDDGHQVYREELTEEHRKEVSAEMWKQCVYQWQARQEGKSDEQMAAYETTVTGTSELDQLVAASMGFSQNDVERELKRSQGGNAHAKIIDVSRRLHGNYDSVLLQDLIKNKYRESDDEVEALRTGIKDLSEDASLRDAEKLAKEIKDLGLEDLRKFYTELVFEFRQNRDRN